MIGPEVHEVELDAGEKAAEEPRSPYFAPRRLGATAPHDCRIYSVDLRDGPLDEDEDPSVLGDEPVRRLEDPDLLDQLELLLDAGLRASA